MSNANGLMLGIVVPESRWTEPQVEVLNLQEIVLLKPLGSSCSPILQHDVQASFRPLGALSLMQRLGLAPKDFVYVLMQHNGPEWTYVVLLAREAGRVSCASTSSLLSARLVVGKFDDWQPAGCAWLGSNRLYQGYSKLRRAGFHRYSLRTFVSSLPCWHDIAPCFLSFFLTTFFG